MSSDIAIELQNVRKEYGRDGIGVIALADVSLQIPKGEFFCLMGPSGSGKSTLLHLVACIDRPSQGTVRVFGDDLSTLTDKQKARWRSENVGYVFQTFNLIPVLTALENVELPLLLTNLNKQKRREQARRALSIVSLEDRLDHYPRQLSGGQEQRVAIARAIVTDAAIILADEPTGDLDAASAKDVLTILSSLNEKYQKTIVMVTHDPHAAQYAHKSRYLEKGDLLPEGQTPQ
jgi:putative ABC transport system ATP-binding protein